MAAARLDIQLEEHSDLKFEFTYYDPDGDAVDLTDYGATVVFAKNLDSPPFLKGTHNDSWVQVGGSNGLIVLDIPYTEFQNLDYTEGVWQLYVYPTANDITDRPKRLIEGAFQYSKSILY